MQLEHPRRSLLENVLLAVVFVAILAFFINSYYLEQKVYKQKALHYQLMILRQGVNMYNLVNRDFPDNLAKLATSTYRLPGEDINRVYIERFPISTNGKLLDPFGNPYAYEQKHGWVMSTTPGYDYW